MWRWIGLLAWVVGCTGGGGSGVDAGLDGGPADAATAPGDPGTYLSVTLRRGPDGLSVLDAQALAWPSPPLLATDGELLVLGWRGVALVDAGFARFPTAALGEGEGVAEPVELGDDVTTTLELLAPDGLDRLTVLDATGQTVAELPLPADPPALTEAEAWIPLPEAPWLAVLRPAGVRLLPAAIVRDLAVVSDPVVDLGDAERARVVAALRLINPEALLGIRYVVLSTFRSGGRYRGFQADTALALRADLLAAPDKQLEFTVLHEGAHVFDAFLGRATTPQAVEGFLVALDPDVAADVRARLQDRIRRRLFDRAVGDTFRDLMAVAQEEGLVAGDYCYQPGDCWQGPDEGAFARAAADPYGTFTPAEDVATWVHRVRLTEQTAQVRTALCAELATARDRRGRGHLAAYAKLAILRGVGLLSEDDFTTCVGGFPIPRPERPGITLYRGDDEVFELPLGVQAGWVDVLGFPMFSVIAGTADGQYRGLIQVQAPTMRRFPARLVSLYDINLATVNMPLSGFFLAHESEPGRARASRSGLVLFTHLSADRVEGVILFLRLQSDLFVVTDTFEVGTFLWTP